MLQAEREQSDLSNKRNEMNTKFRGAYLNQNFPNPSNNSTSIGFFVPENIELASIIVHDLNGHQIKKFDIQERGKGKIEIQNGEIGNGIFLFTLLLDNSALETRKMILTGN